MGTLHLPIKLGPINSFFHSLPEFNLSLIGAFTRLTQLGPYRATTFREGNLTLDHMHTFLTTQGHGGPPRMRYQLNAGATSETTQTWKSIHIIHAPIHSNKVNMKGWLWRPNDIRGSCGPKASWHLAYRWGKPRRKNSSRQEIEPVPAAWTARMIAPAPQQWTNKN